MTATDLEGIILRNAKNFLWVHRAGGGAAHSTEGSTGGLYNSVSGQYICAVGGGWLPEYSRMMRLKWGCECSPSAECQTGAHGTQLKRGWRNILYELFCKGHVRESKEIRRTLGDEFIWRARNRGMSAAPMGDTEAPWKHSGLTSAA